MDQQLQLLPDSKIADETNIEQKLNMNGSGSGISTIDESSNSDVTETLCNPALKNEKVLNRVFGFLELQDIKICRLVSRSWNAILEPVIRKRSLIIFTPKGDKTFEEFKKVFESADIDLPFENFKLKNCTIDNLAAVWTAEEVEEVLRQLGSNLKRLELDVGVVQPHARRLQMESQRSFMRDDFVHLSKITSYRRRTGKAGETSSRAMHSQRVLMETDNRSTLKELAESTDTIFKTRDELVEQSSVSKKLLGKYGRREWTDKFLICLAVAFIFVCVVYII